MIDKNELRDPSKEYRPDIRWWLAEATHTEETLLEALDALDGAGFGAVEFVALAEPGADHARFGWGSDKWVRDSALLFRETTRRGMGVSTTSGTHWSNTNLTDIPSPDDPAASKELDCAVEKLAPGQRRSGPIPVTASPSPDVHRYDLVAVVAARVLEEREEETLLAEDTAVLTDLVRDGCLDWCAPQDGSYLLFFFHLHGTGQTAGPANKTAYTVNYIDPDGAAAFIRYWDSAVFTPELCGILRRNPRPMLYMDSLEVSTYGSGGQFWGACLLEEFRRRRGYDAVPYLPFLLKENGEKVALSYYYQMPDAAKAERIRNDLYQTLTELYMEHLLRPMQHWLHGHGMQLRSEISYGMPFEISLPGKYVDGIETESLEFASQIDCYRALAGPAHLYGRIYSAETGANRLNYRMGLDFYTQIIYTQFAAGVTRTVLHGFSAEAGSAGATYWPGHEGMYPIYAERFGPRQPAWQFYPDWLTMIGRYQYLLRSGSPRRDVGILRLDYYFNNQWITDHEAELYAHEWMRGGRGIYWQDMGLQHAGYTWDYFAPQILEEDFITVKDGVLCPEGAGYRALIVYQEGLPLSAARRLLTLAEAGLPVLFVNGATELIRPHETYKTHGRAASQPVFLADDPQELDAVIAAVKALPNVRETDVQAETVTCLRQLGVQPRVRFAAPCRDLLTTLTETAEEGRLFVYNMMYAEPQPCTAALEAEGCVRPSRIDCLTGEVREIGAAYADGRTGFSLTLQPGEAMMILLDKTAAPRLLPRPVCAEVLPLTDWEIVIEDWDEGGQLRRSEELPDGTRTEEVLYTTRKTPIRVADRRLRSWREYPEVGDAVSGLGHYTARIALTDAQLTAAAIELTVGGSHGCAMGLTVNGQAVGFDADRRRRDVLPLLRPGENTIRITVATPLNNRLNARGYYERSVSLSYQLRAMAELNDFEVKAKNSRENSVSVPFCIEPFVDDYGLEGPVTLRLLR